ncbi:MAG: UvrD-helicase domain-containing protein [Phycisphaeraceae bacterium]|nr:UvrD-helicase domain-containing protein [Phycisphaeraceae bacterium]
MMPTSPHQVVRASAGTGKTYALTSHYLSLLDQHQPPGGILATTFTRKAAGEIVQRILARLAAGAATPDKTRQLAEFCRQLHRVNILTLDSFFSRLAMGYRFELGLPLGMRVMEETDAAIARLRRRAIERLLGDDEPHVLLDLLRRLHHDTAQRSVTRTIDDIVTSLLGVYQQAPERQRWEMDNLPAPLDDEKLATAIATLENMHNRLPADKRFATRWKADIDAACNGKWETIIGSKLATSETFYGKPVPEAISDAYQPLLHHARAVLLRDQAQRTLATWELLHRFDGHFAELRESQQAYLFSDLPRRLALFLSQDDEVELSDLYFRLDRQFAHLMLDEFQDTSLEQWRVLDRLAEEVVSYSDGEHSFFCVGDVKQAIYGWRGGCAEIFDHIENNLPLMDDAVSTLNLSYRSSPVILDAVNAVFADLAGNPAVRDFQDSAEIWQDRFNPHEAKHAKLTGYVELSTTAAETEDDADDDNEAEIAGKHDQAVADRIAELARTYPGYSLGVLVGTNRKAQVLIDALRAMDIPASGEGGSPLTDDPAVLRILAALRMADHPGDSAAAFAAFHSPLRDELRMTGWQGTEAQDAAARIRAMLATEGYGRTLTRWATALASLSDTRGGMRLEQLLSMAETYQPQATSRPCDFVDHVAATSVEQPTGAGVRVMTIHKAKGLEFDVVVLPELRREIGKVAHDAVYVTRPSPTEPIDAVYRAVREGIRELDRRLVEAHQQEQARRVMDDLCSLYVAMTRAKRALVMLIPPLTRTAKGAIGAKGWTSKAFDTLLRRALSTLGEDESEAGDEVLYRHGDARWPVFEQQPISAPMPLSSRRPKVRISRGDASRTPRVVSPSSLEAGSRVQVADLLALQTPAGRLRGSAIHNLFELVEWIDRPLPEETQRKRVVAELSPEANPAWQQEMLDTFARMLDKNCVRRVLTKPADEVELWRERAFAVAVGGRVLRGRFDRVMVHRQDGRAVRAELIDYKTDRVDGGQLEEATRRYRPQMQAYCAALARMLGLREDAVTATLLFVEAGEAVGVA